MKLLNDDELERSAVVANCRMNRERDLTGSNGYSKEVGFNAEKIARITPLTVCAAPLLAEAIRHQRIPCRKLNSKSASAAFSLGTTMIQQRRNPSVQII